MGGYARYVPSSEGNNVVHLDGAEAAAPGGPPDDIDGALQQPQQPLSQHRPQSKQRKRGFFVTRRAVILAAVIAVCALLLVALAAYFAAARSGACLAGGTSNSKSGGSNDSKTSGTGSQPLGEPPGGLRLPTNVRAEHYRLTLAPYIYGENTSTFYFTGSVDITVRVLINTDNIRLHADRIPLTPQVFRISSVDNPGDVWPLIGLNYSDPSQWYTLTLEKPLLAGRAYRIEVISYRKPLLLDLRGLYYSVYTEKGKTKYLAVSQLQATDARKTFPCMDEPAFKARFDVTLVRRSDFHAISNMPSKSVQRLTDPSPWFPNADPSQTWVLEQFETTPIMSTYLLAFVVSQFNYLQGTDSRGRLYRNWARPELVNTTEYAMKAVTNITEFFEAYFDVPFPLKKTDQMAVPDFNAGGMENWGLITYREIRLLFDPLKDTTASLQNIGNVISHEVAHMWFGNLVTPQWWDDIWLNEGFATFTQILGIRQLHPDWDIDSQFVTESQMQAFQADSKRSSRPIYTEVQNPNQITEIFDAITYRKGAAVLRMVYYFLGDGTFRRAIGAYLRQNSYANTFHTSLYESLTNESRSSGRHGLNVSEIMDRWIKQMGYPVLTCSREGTSLRIRQSHFLSDPSRESSDVKFKSEFNNTWIVPVTMANQRNVTSASTLTDISGLVQWLRTESQLFDAGPPGSGWYLLNLRSAGFYRVNYDKENWLAIIKQLRTDHTVFAPQERARLLDDSFSLAAAGRIDYSVPLNMTLYLGRENHYVPWRAAISKLSLLHSMLHRTSAVYGPFSMHMRSLIEPLYKQLGFEADKKDSHLRRLLRNLIVAVACQFGVPDCHRDARQLFQNFSSGGFTGDLQPDIRRIILCEGITAASSEAHWDALYKRGRADPHPGVQSDILRALSCTPQPWLLNRYLDYALDDQMIRRQDAAVVFSGVSTNANGLQIVWDYLRDNWSTIVERIPGSFSTSYFIILLGEFNTPQRLKEMIEFKAKYKDKLSSAERAMNQALENVKNNIRWMDTNLAVVKQWLSEHSG